jgi:glutathione S-transferase
MAKGIAHASRTPRQGRAIVASPTQQQKETPMKLYYSPGACSLSPHIALHESGLKVDATLVNLKTHQLADGTDYYTINPKGSVPLLQLDDGQRLTEGPAIVQYIADQAPASGLAPAAGTMARYRLIEWLNFTSTELHKGFSPLFNPAMVEEAKPIFRARLVDRFKYVNEQLEGKSYLMGETFTVADGYLFTVTNWCKHVGVDISGFAHLGAFMARVAARPAVQAAMKAEGLIK